MLLTIIYYVAVTTQLNDGGNATYDDAVYVIAAIEIHYNVAVLV